MPTVSLNAAIASIASTGDATNSCLHLASASRNTSGVNASSAAITDGNCRKMATKTAASSTAMIRVRKRVSMTVISRAGNLTRQNVSRRMCL